MTQAAAAPAPSRVRTYGIFAAKVVLATVLLWWLERSGSLQFSALAVLLHPAWLLAVNVLVFFCSISLATARWRALLELCGARLSFVRAWQLQLVGVFFNTVIPGNVGGDVLKALYVARDQDVEKRPAILLVVVLERALGLAALLALGGIVVAVRWPLLAARNLTGLAATVVLLAIGTIVGLAGFTIVARRFGDRLLEKLSGPSKLAGFLQKIVRAMVLLSAQPAVLVRGLFYSVVLQGVSMSYFVLVASHLSPNAVSYGDIAAVFPLGLLTMLLPISPAGFGVGHVAFDKLFSMIGLEGGANVFNVFLIGQITPGLCGVIPYLGLRKLGGRLAERAGGTSSPPPRV